ncbi:MAG TPA: hypothetical protein VMV03_09225, partial [Spirochaetia bacterium]|nr:hypothetical protein [Spirochaetia bacterium]
LSYVNVQLTDSSGYALTAPIAVGWSYYDLTSGYAHYTVQFTKLKNETYGLFSQYINGSPSGTFYPAGSPLGSWFYDPSGVSAYLVTLPFAKSSDITNLSVIIP